jgi:hypothetical protein
MNKIVVLLPLVALCVRVLRIAVGIAVGTVPDVKDA